MIFVTVFYSSQKIFKVVLICPKKKTKKPDLRAFHSVNSCYFRYWKAVDGLKTIDLSGFVGVSPQIRPKFKQLGIFLLFAQSFYPLVLPSGVSRPLELYLDFRDLVALIWSRCQFLWISGKKRKCVLGCGFLLDDQQAFLSACYTLSLKLQNIPYF